jgi:hypothetical protein
VGGLPDLDADPTAQKLVGSVSLTECARNSELDR